MSNKRVTINGTEYDLNFDAAMTAGSLKKVVRLRNIDFSKDVKPGDLIRWTDTDSNIDVVAIHRSTGSGSGLSTVVLDSKGTFKVGYKLRLSDDDKNISVFREDKWVNQFEY